MEIIYINSRILQIFFIAILTFTWYFFPMKKIIVSRCLLGEHVRYDGNSCPIEKKYLDLLEKKFIILPFCPENAAGLNTPREPIVMVDDSQGQITLRTRDSHLFMPEIPPRAIAQFRKLCPLNDIYAAILKAKSPSCGFLSTKLYDRNDNIISTQSDGFFASFLKENYPGILIRTENDFLDLIDF